MNHGWCQPLHIYGLLYYCSVIKQKAFRSLWLKSVMLRIIQRILSVVLEIIIHVWFYQQGKVPIHEALEQGPPHSRQDQSGRKVNSRPEVPSPLGPSSPHLQRDENRSGRLPLEDFHVYGRGESSVKLKTYAALSVTDSANRGRFLSMMHWNKDPLIPGRTSQEGGQYLVTGPFPSWIFLPHPRWGWGANQSN